MRQIRVRAVLTALWSGLLLIASVATASAQGVRVIVELRLPSTHTPEGELPNAATVISQRQAHRRANRAGRCRGCPRVRAPHRGRFKRFPSSCSR